VLGRRLKARKLARLVEVQCEGPRSSDKSERRPDIELLNRERLVQEAAQQALELGSDRPGRVVGVVVNRVATARRGFEELRSPADADVLLLTGRARPFDRDRLLE